MLQPVAHGRDPEAGEEAAISRDAIEAYLRWMTAPLAPHTSSADITCLHRFLDTCRRDDGLPARSSMVAFYPDALSNRSRPLPRFIREFVMNQLEDPAATDTVR